jgi:hypothetical protein
MKRPHYLVLLISLAAPVAAMGIDATNSALGAPSSRADYVSFRVISERNIFNPRRSGRSSIRASTRSEPERRVRMERFALLGTMSYEKGRYAFFDGSGSEFRKVAKPDDLIAGFKITEVAPTCVKLEMTNGQVLELCVGMQMKKREDEDWQLAGKADSAEGTNHSTSSASSAAASGPESDEVLKRLQQRREQDGVAASVEAVATPPAGEVAKPDEAKPAAAPGESDDVLKKLLQKREQELNK